MSSQSVKSRARLRTRAEWCKFADGGVGGWAYYRGDRRVDAPKDYRHRNRLVAVARAAFKRAIEETGSRRCLR